MLNKDNYVTWSSCLRHYAKSKPNEKLIYISIMHSPYERRMIPKLVDPDCEVLLAETFHEQTDKELTEKEKIWLHVQQMMKGLDNGIQEKKDKLPTCNNHYPRQPVPNLKDIRDPTIAMNMALVLMAKMIRGNDRNQFRQHVRQNLRNHNGYNAVPNVGNQVVHNVVQKLGIQNVGNQNGLIFVSGIANQNRNQNENGHVVVAWAEAEEFDLMAVAKDLDLIEKVNANCILMANLQQASTSSTQTDKAPIYDLDGSIEEAAKFVRDFKSPTNKADKSLAKHKALEFEIKRLLREVVSQDIMSIVKNPTVVETSDLQTEL
nr:hypothetical protein [Tanacetum cinerariifolium]